GREKVQRAIVLITDGENHESGALAAAKEAAERGIRVYVIGVGSSKGSPIPITEGGTDYMKDKDGNVVITQLNEGMCQELAKEGKGSYIRLDNTNRAQQFLEKELSKLSKSDNETVVYASYNEQFIFITWMVLLLLIIDTLLLERSNPLFKNLKIFQ
ncbi:MAG: VWA domain-containing protein, partial [Bacteroidaceae bacterium]|nr:VWA domain-containing protein [Bacteroidaceae bacterium]